jgi:hypothetical protein
VGKWSAGAVRSGAIYAALRDNPKSALIQLVATTGLLVLTAAEQKKLVNAANRMLLESAYETPFHSGVIEHLAVVAASSGFQTTGKFCETIRDTPVSGMLSWALYLGSK